MDDSASLKVRIQLDVDLTVLRVLDTIFSARFGDARPPGAKAALCAEALACGLWSLADGDTAVTVAPDPDEGAPAMECARETIRPLDLSDAELDRLEPDTDEPDSSVDFCIHGEGTSEHTQQLVHRSGEYLFGSRSGADRRTEDRGLDAGRRVDDQRRVRRHFINRIVALADQGLPAKRIAAELNEHGVRTARGHRWTSQAIDQLLRTESARLGRRAWLPRALVE
jgi:hypothetical protein